MTCRVVPTVDVFTGITLDQRIVGHVWTDRVGERDAWELHPDQDELLYLVHGTVDVILRDSLEDETVERRIPLEGGQACVVAAGVWHRQIVRRPSLLLFVSPSSVHLPYTPADGWCTEQI